jgi:hypothetical protein
MSGEFRTILKGGLSMPRSERGKTKTNQAISMRLYLDDDFKKRKKILSRKTRDTKLSLFIFSEVRFVQGGAGAHRDNECGATSVRNRSPTESRPYIAQSGRRPMSRCFGET